MKRLAELDEAEILALAISSEEEDARIYLTFASRLRGSSSSCGEIRFSAIS